MATSKELLALQPGARLFVQLRSGRRIAATLRSRPTTSAGKPGPNRVQLDVCDHVHRARLERWVDQHPGVYVPFDHLTKANHTINGRQVLRVLRPGEYVAPCCSCAEPTLAGPHQLPGEVECERCMAGQPVFTKAHRRPLVRWVAYVTFPSGLTTTVADRGVTFTTAERRRRHPEIVAMYAAKGGKISWKRAENE